MLPGPHRVRESWREGCLGQGLCQEPHLAFDGLGSRGLHFSGGEGRREPWLLPKDLHQEVLEYATGWGTTKVNEDQFNNLRSVEKKAPAGRLGGRAIWHASISSPILPEADVPRLTPTAQDRIDAALLSSRDLAKECFDARRKVGEFSLGEQRPRDLKDHGPKWATVSPERFLLRPLALRGMLKFQGDIPMLKTQFYSLLVNPGELLIHRKDGKATAFWALGCSEFGVLVWKCTCQNIGEHRIVKPMAPNTDNSGWEHWHLNSYREFYTLPLQAMAPTVAWKALQLTKDTPADLRGIVLVTPKKIKPEPLLKSAARRGFCRLTVHHMSALVEDAEVPFKGRRPDRERDLAELLVRWQFPDVSGRGLEEFLKHRSMKAPQAHPTILCEENVQAVEGILHDDELDVAKQTVVKCAPARKPQGDKHAAGNVAASSSSSSSGGGAAAAQSSSSMVAAAGPGPRARAIPPGSYTADQAREFMPQGGGAWLGIHSGAAWQVKYPKKATYPKSHTQTWSEDDKGPSHFEALLGCLKWAWDAHSEATGQICPWTLP